MSWAHVVVLEVREVALLDLEAGRHHTGTGSEPVAILAAIGTKIELVSQLCDLDAEAPVRVDELDCGFPRFDRVARLEPPLDLVDGVFYRGNRRSMSFWWMMPSRRRYLSA